jgi:hypothetical protein
MKTETLTTSAPRTSALSPELLAYLVAAFLLFDGLLFLVIGWQLRRFARLYNRWWDEWWSSPER